MTLKAFFLSKEKTRANTFKGIIQEFNIGNVKLEIILNILKYTLGKQLDVK